MKKGLRRTALYIPGNNPAMIQNAGIFGADSVVLDLEDAVSVNEKDSARFLVRNALNNINYGNTEVIVRINSLSTPYGREDLEIIGRAHPDGIRLPKTESVKDIEEVDGILSRIEKEEGFKKGSTKIMPIIESAKGLFNVFEIVKASRRVAVINFGAEDYTADIGAQRTKEGKELFDIRTRILLAARVAGIDVQDSVFAHVYDIEGLIIETKFIKQLGFDGKSVIHPTQIKPVHQVFTPTEEEIKNARRIISAIEEAKRRKSGVISLDGRMVDAPVVAKAQRVLKYAQATGLI